MVLDTHAFACEADPEGHPQDNHSVFALAPPPSHLSNTEIGICVDLKKVEKFLSRKVVYFGQRIRFIKEKEISFG